MSISRLFTSEDVGAPNVKGSDVGSIYTILKAVLFDGFGETLPLGWTMPLYDNSLKVAVFRNNTIDGSGCFLRIEDNASILNSVYTARMYSSMDTIHTGTSPLPLSTYSKNTKSTVTGAKLTWRVIGDDRGFYLILKVGDAYAGYPAKDAGYVAYFGDIVSCIPEEDRVFGLFANNTSEASFGTVCGTQYNVYSDANQYCMINRNPITHKNGAVSVRMFQLNPFAGSAQLVGGTVANIPLVGNMPQCVDTCIAMPDASIVGKLPGLYAPVYSQLIDANLQYYKDRLFVSGANKFMQVLSWGAANNATAISQYVLSMIKIGRGFRA